MEDVKVDQFDVLIRPGAIVLSMSALNTYLRCRKKFKFMYVDGLQDKVEKEREALSNGTAFHELMRDYVATGKTPTGPMSETAIENIRHNPPPKIDEVMVLPGSNKLAIDESMYYKLYDGVYLRCSFDLVFRKDDVVTIRDYKTFSRAPSFNIDLDFQGSTYLALASMIWPTKRLFKFEHQMVRDVPPGSAHGTKPVKYWETGECYFNHSMLLSREEMEDDWEELLILIAEVVGEINEGKYARWFRSPQKGGGYNDCASCHVKNLCIADKQKNLNSTTIDLISQPHDTVWST